MICLIMVTILVSKYAGTDNSGGNIGAIFFFFLTIVGYVRLQTTTRHSY
jgi:hypothetical protein